MKTFKECIEEAALNGTIGYFMGWDEKHGPTLQELEAFELMAGGSIEEVFLRANPKGEQA